ncbi:ribosomal silencing factor RsfS-like protein, 312 isoform X1 [Osmia lignaria lignaria]|uniref:ribosomal silencing factor RsfS-like protein, 312 isoform X1 n=1 Tax=Osmia lignaria lignaria TaxID=1437193 RepID=UPI001478F41A|nr:mitochondrial assembly of ribosomal large subunit protein 1 isoform X1 [Osmia lignaria]
MRMRLIQTLSRSKKLLCEYSKPRTNKIITYSLLKQVKNFSTNNQKCIKHDDQNQSHNLPGSINITHEIFEDKNAEIIYDVSETQETINLEDLRIEKEDHDPYEGINLERGTNGVFKIEDLVLLLQKENAKNIFVASVPPELSYVDYMVVVTGKSNKHMQALAEFVRKVYKLKRHKTDLIPKIEGKDSNHWIALDLGNIALHIFSKSARPLYDLETLWSVGPDYDDKCKSASEDIMEQYNAFLSDLEPLENDEQNEAVQVQSS